MDIIISQTWLKTPHEDTYTEADMPAKASAIFPCGLSRCIDPQGLIRPTPILGNQSDHSNKAVAAVAAEPPVDDKVPRFAGKSMYTWG